MKNYSMVLEYEGTKYNGWQKQGNTGRTIQGELERALSKLTGQEVEVIGSGRTDAGVHAYGQVANFHVDWDKDAKSLMEGLNASLPQDIGVVSIEETEERFHSRLNAKSKIYEYRLWTSITKPVFQRRLVFPVEKTLDIAEMKKAATYFMGTHDFKAFCANKRMKKSTVRTIYSIHIEELPDEVRLVFHGNGFLYNMVRIITGTLIEVGEGKRSASEISRLFESGNREEAGFTAPAQGLSLQKVYYTISLADA